LDPNCKGYAQKLANDKKNLTAFFFPNTCPNTAGCKMSSSPTKQEATKYAECITSSGGMAMQMMDSNCKTMLTNVATGKTSTQEQTPYNTCPNTNQCPFPFGYGAIADVTGVLTLMP
jgi:hypothetical protein